MRKTRFLENTTYIIVGAIVAFLILQVLGWGLGTEFPVVSVVSGSMRHDTPTFEKWVQENNLEDEVSEWKFSYGLKEGDMIIITGTSRESLEVGDVVVYQSPSFKYPIIHRLIDITENGTYIIKGDNNPKPDPYEVQFEWIEGKAVFAVPGLGIPRFMMLEILRI